MARTTQQCGSIDGRSSTWLARSSLLMRVEILGGYRITFSKSRSAYRFVYSICIRDHDRAVTS